MKILVWCSFALLTITGIFRIVQQNTLENALWLTGTWENKTPRGSVFETWSYRGGNSLSGKSYQIKEADTIIFETVTIQQENDQLLYTPTVTNQNNGKPVIFKSTYITESQLKFENPEHDFPQMITYTKITQDSLVAEISGTSKGNFRKVTFPMKKVK